jgi:DNA (cytosine-5)-methyltransferase 1
VSRPRLLDLFCGGGGAAMGYARAGFEVVGVDIKPQPRYPFEFVQGDALAVGAEMALEGRFDAVHASPPCQHYSSATRDASLHPDLYGLTRDLLDRSGLPYAIENVIGAPYSHGIVLCGSMFGLEADDEWLQRHRNFEASWFLFQPECKHRKDKRPVTITGQAYVSATREYSHSRQTTFPVAQRLMGIDWMTRDEMKESIPPAYTEYIGKALMAQITAVAA